MNKTTRSESYYKYFSDKKFKRGDKLPGSEATILDFEDDYVLAVWDKSFGPEYITWLWDDDGNTYHGHYFNKLKDALNDFWERVYKK